jgi:LPXTG-site transpeptidase (sortase) family protein
VAKQNARCPVADVGKSILIALSLMLVSGRVAVAYEPASPDGTPARLVIPSIALDEEIVPVGWTPIVVKGETVGLWDTLDNHVGWHNLSARLGQGGNTVLNGHSNIYARVFQDLIDVEIGDKIIAFSSDQTHHYTVTETILVKEKGVPHEQRAENGRLIAPTNNERLTLITCAGRGATHRLLVIAGPVSHVSQ